jgi:hypothetical protein
MAHGLHSIVNVQAYLIIALMCLFMYHPALLHDAVNSQPIQHKTAKFLGVDLTKLPGQPKTSGQCSSN